MIQVSESARRCRRCGTPSPEPARFCSQCGTRLGERSPARLLLDTLGAFVLGIVTLLLGGLGTCFLILAVSGVSGGGPSIGLAVTLLLVAAAAFAGVAKIIRRGG